MTTSPSHAQLIRRQFDLQALPFSAGSAIRDPEALALLLEAADARPGMRTLDVACGPGWTVLAFAEVVAHATGLDMSPAMSSRAGRLTERRRRNNVAWDGGDALSLPYADASFDAVTTRFSWHHLEAPEPALREMMRVCKPGGRTVVCDAVAPVDSRRSTAFLAMERVRDPSTIRFLTAANLLNIFRGAGLQPDFVRSYPFVVALESLLRASFPDPGGEALVRQWVWDSLADDGLGLASTLQSGDVRLQYTALVCAATFTTPC